MQKTNDRLGRLREELNSIAEQLADRVLTWYAKQAIEEAFGPGRDDRRRDRRGDIVNKANAVVMIVNGGGDGDGDDGGGHGVNPRPLREARRAGHGNGGAGSDAGNGGSAAAGFAPTPPRYERGGVDPALHPTAAAASAAPVGTAARREDSIASGVQGTQGSNPPPPPPPGAPPPDGVANEARAGSVSVSVHQPGHQPDETNRKTHAESSADAGAKHQQPASSDVP